MPDKTPQGRAAVSGLPGAWFSDGTVDSRLAMFRGFPISCLNTCISWFHRPHGGRISAEFRIRVSPSVPQWRLILPVLSPRWEPLGLPEFSGISLPTCHGLRTPADLRYPRHFGYLSCCLRYALKPSASATNSSRSCTSTSGCASPLRPMGFSAYA